RHGFRLDAADKQWHLSSPTPYDPPLTYSGWQAAKNLGVRIASIIQEKVKEEEAAALRDPASSAKRKPKRYKVVLHSSPFLRCIQTAIAISAGLAQDSTPFGPLITDDTDKIKTPTLVQSPRCRPTVITDAQDFRPTRPVLIRRSVLRLDAFLGEWLSPGYFELITPPPESVMMLASAKADLLRREDYNNYPNFAPPSHAHSNSQGASSQGQLWSPVGRSSSISIASDGSDCSSASVGSLSRSDSVASQGQGPRSRSVSLAQSQSSEGGGYVSPVPHYAVNNNSTIPPGYVAHARDACVDIDYQWDSMRPPLDWGDGGVFPEEWASMHKRFREGIHSLVDWYSTTEAPTEMVTKSVSRYARRDSVAHSEYDVEDPEEYDTEAVVIMVSHGAGCNALIGAITHQPVLMDVGMASLTMAVRKPIKEVEVLQNSRSGLSSPERSRKHKIPIHQCYDLKLFANTEHLRSPPPTPSHSRSPSIAGVFNGNNSSNGNRGRFPSSSFSSSLSNFSFNDNSGSRASSANAVMNNIRKAPQPPPQVPRLALGMNSNSKGGGITVGSGVTSFMSRPFSLAPRKPSIGLWSPISADETHDDEEDDMVLNFSHEKATPITNEVKSDPVPTSLKTGSPSNGISKGPPTATLAPSPISLSEEEIDPKSPVDATGLGLSGLWGGGPRPPGEAESLRDMSSAKRRWTVTERS
ncbi:hypothetical protein B0T17DRAFT_485126, partial [Bombardia bombarda]